MPRKSPTAGIKAIDIDVNNPTDSLEAYLPGEEELSDVDKLIVSVYKVALHNGTRDGKFDISQKCLVCKKPGHSFEGCPILNNHELMKQFHINFCLHQKKLDRLVSDLSTEQDRALNAVIMEEYTDSDGQYDEIEHTYELVPEPDF
jgi:hypothetical protein